MILEVYLSLQNKHSLKLGLKSSVLVY